MRLLLDINVLLDVILEREPWSHASAKLLAALETNRADGFIAAHTLPTIYYVVAKARNRDAATQAMHDLLQLVEVASIPRSGFQQALTLAIDDFNDAVQAAAALAIDADYLVTRNERDFKFAPVETCAPSTILSLL